MGADNAGLDAKTRELRKFIGATLRQVNAIPLADYETRNDVATDLVPRIVAVTGVASEILGLVALRYESTHDLIDSIDGTDFKLLREVDQRMADLHAARDVADLAFMARLGLRWRVDQALGLLSADDPWLVIGQCSSARREVIKSCTAVDVAICRYAGFESDNLQFLMSEISRSLEVRRCYTRLRGELTRDKDETARGLLRRLRLAATALTKLTGSDIYPDLRVSDRQQIRSLQTRILDWLRQHQGAPDGGVRPAVRLITDLLGFAELLQAVNNRSELRDHDTRVVRHAIASISALPDEHKFAAVEDVESLCGLDPEFDRLLAEPGRPVGDWRLGLASLSRRLGVAGDTPQVQDDDFI